MRVCTHVDIWLDNTKLNRRAIGEITVILCLTRLLAPPTNTDRAW